MLLETRYRTDRVSSHNSKRQELCMRSRSGVVWRETRRCTLYSKAGHAAISYAGSGSGDERGADRFPRGAFVRGGKTKTGGLVVGSPFSTLIQTNGNSRTKDARRDTCAEARGGVFFLVPPTRRVLRFDPRVRAST